MNSYRFVSIIIPCRNEEKYISQCLGSLNLQDYPKNKLEIIMVDGASDDGTRKIIESYLDKFTVIKILDNPKKITPISLNIGINNAEGEIIIRMDVHASYESSYVSKCVKYLNEYNADNVGGVIKTVPGENTIIAKAIALALSSKFGAGNSYFRIGSDEPREVDTVPFGCFRKEIFDRIGLFNENLARSQDWELNLRIRRVGGKIVLVPNIEVKYFPKATLKEYFKRNFEDGVWVIYPYKFVDIPFNVRHYVPLIFVISLLGSVFLGLLFNIILPLVLIAFLYLSVALYFSFKIALREKEFIYIILMPLVFFTRHLGFGLGSMWGVIKLLMP